MTIGEEYGGLSGFFMIISPVIFTVLKLGDIQGDLLGRLFGLFPDRVKFFPQTFIIEDFIFQGFGGRLVLMTVIDNSFFNLVDNPAADLRVAEFVLGLTFKNGIFYFYGDGPGKTFADIGTVVVLFKILVDPLEKTLTESTLMGPAVGSELTVYKGKIGLAIAVGMGKSGLDFLAGIVSDIVKDTVPHFRLKKVQKAVFGFKFLFIEIERQPFIETGVVPHSLFNKFMIESIIAENGFVGNKFHISTVGMSLRLPLPLLDKVPLLKYRFGEFFFADSPDQKIGGKGIDRFCTDTIQTDTELEDLVVVFRAGIDDRHAFNDFPQGDPPSVVPYGDFILFDFNVDLLAVAHNEFIDGVIRHLFDEDIDPVVRISSVSQTADIHTGPEPYMLKRT